MFTVKTESARAAVELCHEESVQTSIRRRDQANCPIHVHAAVSSRVAYEEQMFDFLSTFPWSQLWSLDLPSQCVQMRLLHRLLHQTEFNSGCKLDPSQSLHRVKNLCPRLSSWPLISYWPRGLMKSGLGGMRLVWPGQLTDLMSTAAAAAALK